MSQDKHETRQETSSSELTDEQLDQISGGVKPNTPIDLCKAPGVEPIVIGYPSSTSGASSGMPLSNGDGAGAAGGTASGKVMTHPVFPPK